MNPYQSFFARAENELAISLEATALLALHCLQRIKGITVKIAPETLPGIIHALVDSEDGSATIEWICPASRLGFVFDNDDISSWFIVLPDGSSRSGYMGEEPLRELLAEFLAPASKS